MEIALDPSEPAGSPRRRAPCDNGTCCNAAPADAPCSAPAKHPAGRQSDPCGVWLRPMVSADLAAVLAVEQAAYPFPWTETILRDCLRAGYCCLVAERHTVLIGHGIMMMAAEECHILNLCVHPAHQRQGLGRLLLRRLLALGHQHGATTALLEVRVSNQAAIALYRGEGFNEVAIRRNYYPAPHGREDALLMARCLG